MGCDLEKKRFADLPNITGGSLGLALLDNCVAVRKIRVDQNAVIKRIWLISGCPVHWEDEDLEETYNDVLLTEKSKLMRKSWNKFFGNEIIQKYAGDGGAGRAIRH